MFFVKVKRREFQVRFRHENRYHRYTICKIYRGDWIVAEGMAECHPKDNFCKDTGRKLSLARALQTLFPNKKGKITRDYICDVCGYGGRYVRRQRVKTGKNTLKEPIRKDIQK